MTFEDKQSQIGVTINKLSEFIGRRVIFIGMSHMGPGLEIIVGTLNEITENFVHLRDTMKLNAISSDFMKFKPDEYWCGEGWPLDGFAKTFTIIDKETEEIIYAVPWDKLRVDLYFTKPLKDNFYGKPWTEIPIIDEHLYRNYDSSISTKIKEEEE